MKTREAAGAPLDGEAAKALIVEAGVRIVIDNGNRFNDPDRPWTANIEIGDDRAQFGDAFGGTPGEALENLLTEFDFSGELA